MRCITDLRKLKGDLNKSLKNSEKRMDNFYKEEVERFRKLEEQIKALEKRGAKCLELDLICASLRARLEGLKKPT